MWTIPCNTLTVRTAHGVSDGLGATWNGMAGEVILERASEKAQREAAHREYAKAHPRHMETKDNAFYVDGHPFYLRATHFGGEYPLTGYPETGYPMVEENDGNHKSLGL